MNTIPQLTSNEAQEKLIQGVLLVDVREVDEVATLSYKVPNQINIPLTELQERFAEIPTDEPIIVACKSGVRSEKAIAFLQGKGYENLTNLTGGIMAWINAGLPVK